MLCYAARLAEQIKKTAAEATAIRYRYTFVEIALGLLNS
jgi:hypothetical protein